MSKELRVEVKWTENWALRNMYRLKKEKEKKNQEKKIL